MINGRCRHAGDFPCPPNQCKDKVTGECRSFNPRREKANETDDIERASGGGRGYCKQLEGGGMGGGGNLGDEQAYFDRLVGQGDWTEWPKGSGWFFNDPGNDRSQRVWVNRGNLRLDSTGRGYQSIRGDAPPGFGQQGPSGPSGGGPGGPGGGSGPFDSSPGGIDAQIRALLAGIMGGQTRFGPEVMADIAAGAKGLQQSEVASGTEALNEDLARRGLSQSAAGASLAQDVRQQAAGRFDTTMRETRVKKAYSDFDDKMQGLKAAQDYINELHDYELGLDQNSIQREQIAANIAMARERIQAEAQNLMAQLGANRDLASMQIGSTEFMFMQRQLQCMMNPAMC
jgi:hypothetical protein